MSPPDLPTPRSLDHDAAEESVDTGLIDRLRRVARALRGSTLTYRPYDPTRDDPLATITVPDDQQEIDRYWVNDPFAFVAITERADGERSYYAVEPDLDAFETALLDRIRSEIRAPLLYGASDGVDEANAETGADRIAEADADRVAEADAESATGVDNEPIEAHTAASSSPVETWNHHADIDAADAAPTCVDITDCEAAGERLRAELAALIERYGISVDMRTFHALWYYLYRDFRGYGRIDPLLQDDSIEDISCDGPDHPVFIYHEEYTDLRTNVSFETGALDDFVVRLAQQAGHHISVGDPLTEATLPDGSRAELSLGEEVTPHGSAFTVRKYAADPFTPIDLIERGTFDAAGLAYCWLCIEHNKSLLVAGGTAAGKTTTLNALSMFVPPGAKVVTIEDTRELTLAHDNWLAAVTREQLTEGDDIDMYDLLRSALRHRPEYLLVGEVRGTEAETLFQAMNTGHTTLSTIHADSIETAVTRLENEPIGLPRTMVKSLDLLAVQTQRRLNGRRVRRAEQIAEFRGIDDRTDDLDYAETVTWQAESDSFRRSHSEVLESIRAERGWEPAELRAELTAREEFLETLRERGITDYREFTTLIGEYYADASDGSKKSTDPLTPTDGLSTPSSPDGSPTESSPHEPATESQTSADATLWASDDASPTDTPGESPDESPSTTVSWPPTQ